MKLEVNNSHKDFFFDTTRFLISYGGARKWEIIHNRTKTIT